MDGRERGRLMEIRRERFAMLVLWTLAAVGCVLGLVARPSTGSHSATSTELLDLGRVLCTAALAVTLMLGPGVVWRANGGRLRSLGFLAIPGLVILVAVGGLAWALGGSVDPRTVAFASCGPILGLMLGALIGSGPEDVFDPEEQRALLIAALALVLVLAKSVWSVGPAGELYAGTISRTLNPEGRPDSRISYHVVQLIANGAHPYGSAGNALFSPYNFSNRGPWPGMASAPIVLLSGGHPPLGPPEEAWRPFDAQGFMAFRIAMITFSCTVFLALWELVRRLGGVRAARFALLLGVSTPFVFADLWFTWPKLLAVNFVLLAALFVIERRAFRGGLAMGIGFLAHPSALTGLFGLGPISIWPVRGASWKRPQILSAILLLAGTALAVLFWRKVNGPFYQQEGFFEYLLEAAPNRHPNLAEWLDFRVHVLANTLIPFYLPIVNGHDPSINAFGGISPGVVHFFFQYWITVPFAFAIVFLPMLLLSLWRALRRWTWAVTATILLPLLAFSIYWGSNTSGLLREGMQAWVLGVLAVVALQQASAGFPWFRSLPARLILVLRTVEVLALAVGATLGTRAFDPLGSEYRLNDVCALLVLVLAAVGIAWAVWSGTAAAQPDPESRVEPSPRQRSSPA
jgi:hypothetical protein